MQSSFRTHVQIEKKSLNTSSLTNKDKRTKKETRHFDHLGKQPFHLTRLLHMNKSLNWSCYACSTSRFKSTSFRLVVTILLIGNYAN